MLPLLLASSSVYRRDLLSRLRLPFTCSSPDINESHRPDESATDLVKRLSLEKAQALAASGASVTFLTGLALLNSQSGHCQLDCIPFTVHMRTLDPARVEHYLRAEQPYDCAGSFKAEGLGVSLFQRTEGPDATSLVGLPLIRLVDMLLAEGIQIP